MRPPPPSPMPVPIPGAGVLLVGGTFDPPHVGHVELARRALSAKMAGAALVFVPASRSPHKSAGPIASDGERTAMLGLALEGVGQAGVWTDELDRAAAGEASYWVETLARARSVVGGARLGFLIGADQAVAFDRWREAGRILEEAEPVVLLREPWGTAAALRAAIEQRGAWSPGEVDRLVGAAADVGTIDASATEVRELLAQDRGSPRLGSLLDPGVLRYIRDRGLYASG